MLKHLMESMLHILRYKKRRNKFAMIGVCVAHCLICFSILFGTIAVASCGEREVGGKTASELFSNQQVAGLARAAAKGDINAIDKAVADGVDVNAIGIDDATPLLWAIERKNKAGFMQLLEQWR